MQITQYHTFWLRTLRWFTFKGAFRSIVWFYSKSSVKASNSFSIASYENSQALNNSECDRSFVGFFSLWNFRKILEGEYICLISSFVLLVSWVGTRLIIGFGWTWKFIYFESFLLVFIRSPVKDIYLCPELIFNEEIALTFCLMW
jgi:hypothetical protein